MKLKLKVLTGMLAVLASVCTLIPSVGAMDPNGQNVDYNVPIGVGSIARDSLAGPAYRQLPSQVRLFALAAHGSGDEIRKLIAQDNTLLNSMNDDDELIWDVLINKHRWIVIQNLLCTNPTSKITIIIKKSFKRFLTTWNTRTVDSGILTALGAHLPADVKKAYPTLFFRWR